MSVKTAIQAVSVTSDALGPPTFMRSIGDVSNPNAVIARWRHRKTVVDKSTSNEIRLCPNLGNNQHSWWRGINCVLDDGSRESNISVYSPFESKQVAIEGQTDILQVLINKNYIRAVTNSDYNCDLVYDVKDIGMQTILIRILVGSVRGNVEDSQMIEKGVNRLAHCLHAHAAGCRKKFAHLTSTRGGLSPASVRRVQDMIDTILEDGISASPTLAQMAAAANLSISHFVRTFRQNFGMTPHQFVLHRRIERAISLLREPTYSIAEIGDVVGFSTPAHFAAAFQTIVGVTPGSVRNVFLR